MTTPLTLARAVLARGHEGTESHTLAKALVETTTMAESLSHLLGTAEAWRAYWAACVRYEWLRDRKHVTREEWDEKRADIDRTRKALRDMGEEA